jgi:hypothetical protein
MVHKLKTIGTCFARASVAPAYSRDEATSVPPEGLVHRHSIALCASSCALQQFAFDLLSSLVELRYGLADLGSQTVDQQPRLIVLAATIVLVSHAAHVTAIKSIGQNPSLCVLYTDA